MTPAGTPAISAAPCVDFVERETSALAELMAQLCLVEVAGGLGVAVDRPAVEGPEATLMIPGHVGHQHVAVEGRVAGARAAVRE